MKPSPLAGEGEPFPAPSTANVSPRRIRLEASSFCQLRCPSCPTTAGLIGPAIGSGFLRLQDFQHIVDLNPQVERIELSNYGEVFLNPDLLQILEYAQQKGVAIAIRNGANLNNVKEAVLEGLVKYGVQVITCSLDGASNETYKIYRVRGNFDSVIENIKKINRYKVKYNSKLPQLDWQYIVFGHNEHEISRARDMAASLGMDFRTKLTWDDSISPLRNPAFVRAETENQPITRAEYEEERGETYANGICHQLWDEPQVNWNGDVLGCCRNFWGTFGGNAFRDGLRESVNSERMVYARGMLTGRQPPRDDIPCTTCDMYKVMRDRSRFIDRG